MSLEIASYLAQISVTVDVWTSLESLPSRERKDLS